MYMDSWFKSILYMQKKVEAIAIHMCAIWGHRTLPHTEGGNMNCALLKSLVSNICEDSWLKIMQTKVDICLDEAIEIHMHAIWGHMTHTASYRSRKYELCSFIVSSIKHVWTPGLKICKPKL